MESLNSSIMLFHLLHYSIVPLQYCIIYSIKLLHYLTVSLFRYYFLTFLHYSFIPSFLYDINRFTQKEIKEKLNYK